jgi:hypothetical protein
MPYIKQEDRDKFNGETEHCMYSFIEKVGRKIDTAGEFNFVVTTLAKEYLEKHGENYQHYNDLLGALEGIKLELYRRQVAPYEDKKIEENGDV